MGWFDGVRKKLQGRDGPDAESAAPARPDLAEFFGSAGSGKAPPVPPPAPLPPPPRVLQQPAPSPPADRPVAAPASAVPQPVVQDVVQDALDTRPQIKEPAAAPTRPVDAILAFVARDDDTATDVVAPLSAADDDDDAPTSTVDPAEDPRIAEASAVADVEPIHDVEDSRIAIDVRWDVRSAPAAEGAVVHALVSLTPEGSPLVGTHGHAVLHLILALDLSASMRRADKYPVLRKALATLLDHLHEDGGEDIHLSVVAFGRGSEYVLRDVRARTLSVDALQSAVEAARVRFTNYTDVAGALERAFRIARRSHRDDPRMPIRVMVLTDGRPQDIPSAEAAMSRLRSQPADVDCLCFGEDADVETMKKLISGGRGGTVKHVDPQSLGDAFGRIADVAKRVIAKRTLVDVDLREDVLGGGAWRFRPGRHDFGARAFTDGRHFAVDLGTVESERTYSIVLRLRIPPSSPGETEAGRVTVRIPGVGGPRTFEAALTLARHPGKAPGEADPIVRQALEIVDAGIAKDPSAQLRSLKARRALHQQERRDARSLAVIDRAIALLESGGTLDDLTPAEHAVLSAHTRTVHARRPSASSAS